MKKILFILSFFYASLLFSQTISWSGIINENDGEPFENAQVVLTFSILDSTNENLVYSESHTAQTNAMGFLSAEIGNGNIIQGDFSAIDWSKKYKLKTEADAGNGNVVLGTSEMKSVPYANGAITSLEIKNGNAGVRVENGEVKMYMGNGVNSASLNTDGLMKLSGLTGTADADLIADQYGVIRRKPSASVTKYLSVSGAAFSGDDFGFHPQWGVYSKTSGFNSLFAPVYLPDNAVITGMKVVYFDNSTADFSVMLFSHSDTDEAGAYIAGINSNNSTSWQTVNVPVSSVPVNNMDYSYVLNIYCLNWEGNYAKAGIRKVVISYQVTE